MVSKTKERLFLPFKIIFGIFLDHHSSIQELIRLFLIQSLYEEQFIFAGNVLGILINKSQSTYILNLNKK